MPAREMIQSLYGDDAETVLSQVDALLEKYASVRSQPKRLSERDAIMITYGDAFSDKNGSPLDCLRRFATEQLGQCISAIHLLPCFPYTSDDGFSVRDYYQIDPDLGNWDDVQKLGESYELMFDAVVNHLSQASDWFQAFLAGDPDYSDYFLVADPQRDYSSVTRPRALPLLHPYQQGDETVHVWTTFSADQIDLNFHSCRVFVQVLDVLLFYVSRGARYIRLDAIAFIWKQLGTSCMHLPEAHQIIQLYRQLIESIAPHVVIITETNVPHVENVSYFGNGHNEAHMVYNFTLPPLLLHSLHKQDVSTLTRWAEGVKSPGEDACFFNFTASHDGVGVRPLQGIVSDAEIKELAEIAREHGGFVSMRDNGDGTQSPYEINCNYLDFATAPDQPVSLRAQRFLLTQSVMLTMPGVPGIYYHSLIGSQNDRQAAIDSGINRRINRAKINYDQLQSEMTDRAGLRRRVFARYTNMLTLRKDLPAMNPFAAVQYDQQDAVFCITRGEGDDQVSAVHNFSDRNITLPNIAPGSVDLLTGRIAGDNGFDLGPFEFGWIK